MFNKSFDAITKQDIDQLVTAKTPEGRTLDYKSELPHAREPQAKVKFLRDVASFANAAGGFILYGVTEMIVDGKPSGLPESVMGLELTNSAAEIQRLEQIIRSNLDPVVIGVRFRAIEGFPAGPIIILSIPRSFAAPHMIVVDDRRNSSFYVRSGADNHAMDVREIRHAFEGSRDIGERVRRFRDERISRIIAGEGVVELAQRPLVVLQFLPLQSLDPTASVDLRAINERDLVPLAASGWFPKYNLDGRAAVTAQGDTASAYSQLFRNGAFETVSGALSKTVEGERCLTTYSLEEALFRTTTMYIGLATRFNIAPPIVLMLSILGAKDCRLAVDRTCFWPDDGRHFDRSDLLLPEVVIDEFAVPTETMLRPVLDTLWQAAGFEKCHDYDSEGRFERRR